MIISLLFSQARVQDFTRAGVQSIWKGHWRSSADTVALVHCVPKLVTLLQWSWCKIVNTWQIFIKCETFMETINWTIFKVCAQSGHLWPRRKLLDGCATAWSPCQQVLKVIWEKRVAPWRIKCVANYWDRTALARWVKSRLMIKHGRHASPVA